MVFGAQAFQLHSDGTYDANPLLGFLPGTPPRKTGFEIRLCQSDCPLESLMD